VQIFDFLIVLGTNLGLIVQWSSTGGGNSNFSSVTTVIRTFRVGRIFRLVKRAKRLRQLFNTLLLTLPALGNIGGLLLLVIFMFTVMGVQNFAKVALQGDLNVHANFQDFPTGREEGTRRARTVRTRKEKEEAFPADSTGLQLLRLTHHAYLFSAFLLHLLQPAISVSLPFRTTTQPFSHWLARQQGRTGTG